MQKSYGEDYDMPFQQRYAGLILELERINKDLNDYLIGVQQCLQEVGTLSNATVQLMLKLNVERFYCIIQSNIYHFAVVE